MRFLLTTLIIITSCFSIASSQNFSSNYNYFRSFAVDDENFYIGLQNGLVIQNRETSESTYLNSLNSNLKSNFIKTMVSRDGVLYIPTPVGLNILKDGKLENIKIGDNDVRDLSFDDEGNIWTFNSKSLLKYDGKTTKEWKIEEYVDFDFEIARINLYKNYVWFSFFKPTYGYKTYYSNRQDNVLRFGLFNLETNEMTTFTDEERGFNFDQSVPSQAISNNEVWLFVGVDSSYIYNIDENKWRANNYRDLLPKKYSLKYSKFMTDKEENVWFTARYNGPDNKLIQIPAVYDYKTKSIKLMYEDIAEEKNLYIYDLDKNDDEIIMSGDGRFYFQEGDSLNIVKFTDFTDYYLFYPGITKYGDEYYTICTDWYDSYQYDRIINIKKREVIEYTQSKKNELPAFSIERFVRDHNVEIIDGGPSIFQSFPNYLKVDNEWKSEDQLGLKQTVDNLQYARFADESLVTNAGDLVTFENDGIFKYSNILEEEKAVNMINKFQVFDEKIYAFGSYFLKENIYNSFVSVLDKQGNRAHIYDPTNSCLTDFKYIKSGFFSYYIDSVAQSMEIDRDGNLWILTQKSIFRINESSDCEYINYIPQVPSITDSVLMVYELIYSKVTNTMFGRAGNTLFNLNSDKIDTVTVTELGYGSIKYMGKCSDGFVYITFQNGGLYRVNSIRDFEPIEIISGKETDLVINHVSLFQDTLYLSTGIGLIKITNPLSTVENDETSNNSISVFPNPTADYITLENIAPNSTIQILSLSGSMVKEVIAESRIDVRDLSAGVYMIKVGSKVQKFVKY